MTRQTISICNIKGGVALDGDEADVLAELLEWAASQSPDTALHMRGRARLRRVIRVLRGEAPVDGGNGWDPDMLFEHRLYNGG
jgi:hypothetical protein